MEIRACAGGIYEEVASAEFSSALRARLQEDSVPLSASMEWTFQCNLACRHCYARFKGHEKWELRSESVEELLLNLAEAGVLFLTITGGDPLIRPDFQRLYLRAKELGFVISLFTNATLVTAKMASFLAKNPPRRIEVTTYGAHPECYESVTQRPGSFDRFQKGLTLLLETGLNINLKALLLTLNYKDFELMHEQAARMGLPFRYDGLITPRLDGDRTPLAYRLSPESITALHFFKNEDREKFAVFARQTAALPARKTLFECGAGRLVLHVDPIGQAHPCMQWRTQPLDITTQRLSTSWAPYVRRIVNQHPDPGACNTCSARPLCSYCPAVARLEANSTSLPSDFHCRLAAARRKALNKES